MFMDQMGILREPPKQQIVPAVQIRKQLESQVYRPMFEGAVPSAYLRRAPTYPQASYLPQVRGRWPTPEVYGQPSRAYMAASSAPSAPVALPGALPRMMSAAPGASITSRQALPGIQSLPVTPTRAPSYMIGQAQAGYPGLAAGYAPPEYSLQSAQMFPAMRPKKRKRKKYNEVERFYKCNYKNCTKAYGTLNHLNCHIMLQKHGKKRLPSEFKELRERLKKRRRMQREKARQEKQKEERMQLEGEEKRAEAGAKFPQDPLVRSPIQARLPPPSALAPSPTLPSFQLPQRQVLTPPIAPGIPPLQGYRASPLDASRPYQQPHPASQYYYMYPGRSLAQPEYRAQRSAFLAALPPLRLSASPGASPRVRDGGQLGLAPVANNLSIDKPQVGPRGLINESRPHVHLDHVGGTVGANVANVNNKLQQH